MPAVVTYWQLPDDEIEFLDFLSTTGNIIAVPDQWVRAEEDLAPRPLDVLLRQADPSQFLFGMKEHAAQATIEQKEQGGEHFFCLAHMSPCLISYKRGRFRDVNRLCLSNLAAYWDYPDEEATKLISKEPEFIKWAKRVFRWVQRHTPERIQCKGYPYRATRRVKAAVDQRSIEPILY